MRTLAEIEYRIKSKEQMLSRSWHNVRVIIRRKIEILEFGECLARMHSLELTELELRKIKKKLEGAPTTERFIAQTQLIELKWMLQTSRKTNQK